jgi:hypothetical protein
MKTVYSLNRFILPLVAAVALAVPVKGEKLEGGVVKFPPDKPVLTVETPKDWKVEYLSGAGDLDLEAPDSSVMMSIRSLVMPGTNPALPEAVAAAAVKDEESAKAYLIKNATELGAKGSKPSDPTELTVAGQKAFQTKVKSDFGSDNQYLIFSPDGKTYYWISVTTGDGTKIIESIKPAA